MLFNYHVKEMFGQCAFFPSNTKKTEGGGGRGAAVWGRSRTSWHYNVLYTLRDWRPLGRRGGCQSKRTVQAFRSGINVRGLAIHSRTGGKEKRIGLRKHEQMKEDGKWSPATFKREFPTGWGRGGRTHWWRLWFEVGEVYEEIRVECIRAGLGGRWQIHQ